MNITSSSNRFLNFQVQNSPEGKMLEPWRKSLAFFKNNTTHDSKLRIEHVYQ